MPGFLRTIPQTGLATDSQPEQDAWHILTFNLTLEIFQSADQFAFIIGHEMAHIVFGHSLERAEQAGKFCQEYWQQRIARDPRYADDLTYEKLAGDCARDLGLESAFSSLAQQQELKVDDYGRRLMSLACFNPQEAQTAMMNVGAFAGIAGSIFNLSYFDMCGEFCSHPRPRDRTRFLGLPPP